MSEPFIGEIKIFAGNFPPSGWMFCQGQILPISENDTLFNLIGTTYGGDGQETFALPNLASRVPIHMGKGPALPTTNALGAVGGVESVTITQATTPSHQHALLATGTGQTNSPSGAYFAVATSTQSGVKAYSATTPSTPLNPAGVGLQGGSQPHTNIQPSLAMNYIISLYGIYPSPT